MAFKKRYILAQEAEERVVALWRKEHGAFADAFNTAVDACQTIILDMYDNSSADVVEVVRCKDCINWETDWATSTVAPDFRYCGMIDGCTQADEYCSRGKKKDGDPDA